jgi:hypothetical protein
MQSQEKNLPEIKNGLIPDKDGWLQEKPTMLMPILVQGEHKDDLIIAYNCTNEQ